MDLHAMKRKDLQALCKQHKIPANLTNLEMVNKLSSLLNRNKEVDNKKPNSRLRSCLKNVCERESNSASDGVRDSKKVKFSPQNEVVVLDSDSEDVVVEPTRVTRRMSMLRSVVKKGQDFVDNVDKPVKSSAEVVDKPLEEVAVKPVRLTRSTRGRNAVDGVGVEVSVKLPVAETRKAQDFVDDVDKPVKSSAKVVDKPIEEVAVKPVRLTRSTRGRNAVDGVEVSVKLPVAETRKGQGFVDNADKPVKSSEEVVDKPVRATRSSRGRNAMGGAEVSVKLPVAETRKGQDFVDNVDKPVKSSEEVVDKPIEEVAVKPVRLTRATRGRNAVAGAEVSVKLPVAEIRKGQDFVNNVDKPVKSSEEVDDKPMEEVAVKPVRLTRATRGRNAVDGVEVSFKLPVAETRKGHDFVDNADKPVKSSEEVVDKPVRATRSTRGRNAVDENEVSVKLPVVETKKRKVGQRSDHVGLENESGDKPLPIKENPMGATRSRSQRAVDTENSEVLPMVAKRSKKSDNPLPVGNLSHKSDNQRERRKGRGEKMQQNQGLGKAKTGGKSRPKSLQTLQEENASLMKSGGTIHHLAVHQEKTSIPLVSETEEDTLSYDASLMKSGGTIHHLAVHHEKTSIPLVSETDEDTLSYDASLMKSGGTIHHIAVHQEKTSIPLVSETDEDAFSYGNTENIGTENICTENITEVGGEYCTENINAPDRSVCSHEELSASMEEKKNDECESSLEEDKASEKIPALDLSATSLVSATDSGSRDASASLSSRKECSSDKNFQVSLVVNTKMTCPSPKFVEFEYGNGHDEGLGKLFSTPGSNAHPKQGNSYIETEVVPSTKSQECTISEVKNKHLQIDEPQSVVGIQKDEDVKNASDENLGTTCIETEVVSCTKLDYSTLSELKKGNHNIDEPVIVGDLQKDESSLEDVKATENLPALNLSATALASETGSGSPDANTYLSTENECLADPKFQVSLGVNTKMILPSPNFMEFEYGNAHDEGLGKLFSTPGSNAQPKQGTPYFKTEVVPSTKTQECTIGEVKNMHLHIDEPGSVVSIQKDEGGKNAGRENVGIPCIDTEVVSSTKLDDSALTEVKNGNLHIDEPGIVVSSQKDDDKNAARESVSPMSSRTVSDVGPCGWSDLAFTSVDVSPDTAIDCSPCEDPFVGGDTDNEAGAVVGLQKLEDSNPLEVKNDNLHMNEHGTAVGLQKAEDGRNAGWENASPISGSKVSIPGSGNKFTSLNVSLFEDSFVGGDTGNEVLTKVEESTLSEVKNGNLHISELGIVVSSQKDEDGRDAARENVGTPCIDTQVVSFTKLDDSTLTDVKNRNLHIDEPGVVVSSQRDEDDKNACWENVSPMSSRTVPDAGPCGWSDSAFTSVNVSPGTAIDCSPCEDPFVGGDTDNEAGAVVGLQKLDDSNPSEVKNDNLHMNEHGTVGLQKDEDGKNAGWGNASPISGSKVSIVGSGNEFTSLNVSTFEDSFVGGDTGNEALAKVEESTLSEVKNGNLHIDETGLRKDEDNKNAGWDNVGTPCIEAELVSFTKLDDSTLSEKRNGNLHMDETEIVVGLQKDEDDENACWKNVSPMSSSEVSDTGNEALTKLEDSALTDVKSGSHHTDEPVVVVGLQKDEDNKDAGCQNVSPDSSRRVSNIGSGGNSGNKVNSGYELKTLFATPSGNKHSDIEGVFSTDQNAMKDVIDSLKDHGLNSADSSSRSALVAHDSSIFESPVVSDFICSKMEGFNGSNNLASSSKKSFSEDAVSIICTNRFSVLASMVESVEKHAPSNLFMKTRSYIQEEAKISPNQPFVEIESVSDKEHPEQKNTETELPVDEDKAHEQSLVPNLSPTDLAPTMITVSPVRNAEQIFEVSNPQKSPPSGSFEEDDSGDTHDDESNKLPQQGAPYAETAVVPFGKLDVPHVVGPEDEDVTVIEDTTSYGAASTPRVGNDNEMVLTSEQNSVEDGNGSSQDHGLRTLFATPACGKHFEDEMRSYSRQNPAEDDFLLDHELKLLFASPAGSIHSSSKMFLSEQIATDLPGDEPVENAEDILTQVSDSIVDENTALEKFGAVETSAKAERGSEYLADANAPAEIVVEEKELMEEHAAEANHMKPASSVVAGDNSDPNDDAEEKFPSEEEPDQNSHEDIVTQVSASIVNENSPSGEPGADVKPFTEANSVAEIVVEEEKENFESLIVSNELTEEQAPESKPTSSVHAGTAFEEDAEKWQPCSELVKLKKTLSVASRLLNTTTTMKRREPISSLAPGTPMKILSYDMKENAPASTKMGDNPGSAQPKSTAKRRPLQVIPNQPPH